IRDRNVTGVQTCALPISLEKLSPGRALPISQVVPLQPGIQTVRFAAQCENSGKGAARLDIDFRPRLPAVVITAPAEGMVGYDEEIGRASCRERGEGVVGW